MTKAHSVSRFVKIEHTLFSLPMIFSGAILAADGVPSLRLFILILLGATGARTAAMAMNRIIDREIDKRNPRTASRELPSGKLSLWEAIAVLALGLAIYIACAAAISDFCLVLSPLPLIVFMIYPYMKRFTHYAHFGVGLGLAMAPLGGWFAVRGSFTDILPAVLLSLFTVCWVAGFDIIYSTLDEEFDRNEKLHSFSARYGKEKALRYSGYLHAAAFVALGILFIVELRALAALPFLLLSGYLLYLEHRKAEDVELAFFKINLVVGFAVFAMVMAGVYFV
ncbi:MAG: putative 4-hydroxybenzoate polyprenyltransferase [Bacteroidetes bacterium]|jgi:4-hydroxybenzoate polyprenyltransferase|nr:putative 4-hydroxybenzoate polyprenyltransferase [Bacteroidota bacterium]